MKSLVLAVHQNAPWHYKGALHQKFPLHYKGGFCTTNQGKFLIEDTDVSIDIFYRLYRHLASFRYAPARHP